MDTHPLCSFPEAISQISFHISNHHGVSLHILINCTRHAKRIRVLISPKDCILPRHMLTPESCDDLQANIVEFPISHAAYALLLARMDEIGIYRWKQQYFADSYPPVQWSLLISRTGMDSVAASGNSAYPAEWDAFMDIWNTFARLDRLILISRRRFTDSAE